MRRAGASGSRDVLFDEMDVLVALLAICFPFPSLSLAFCRRRRVSKSARDRLRARFAASSRGKSCRVTADSYSYQAERKFSVTFNSWYGRVLRRCSSYVA